jgi:hypothetical protein
MAPPDPGNPSRFCDPALDRAMRRAGEARGTDATSQRVR